MHPLRFRAFILSVHYSIVPLVNQVGECLVKKMGVAGGGLMGVHPDNILFQTKLFKWN